MRTTEPSRLLAVVAHPDDETFGLGSLLLHAASRGLATTVCCATRGEAGTPRPGSGIGPGDLAAVRERELREAAQVLGVGEVELLGYRDSGMDGQPAAGTLAAADIDEVTAAVAGVVERVRPQVVVTLAADDGHRDHARIRDATRRALEATAWPVERAYLHCLPRGTLRRWADHERRRRPDSPYLDVDELGLGTPEGEVTTVVDTSAHLDARWRAIGCHASQQSPYEGLPGELEQAFLTVEHLVRIRPAADGHEPERDLFA